jgi:amino acid permease
MLGMATITENASDVHRFSNNDDADDINTDEYELIRRPESYTDILATDEHGSASSGSSIGSAIFNLSNSIIGAGAIGLGGAIAATGGIISIVIIILCAILVKISADLTIQLTLLPQSSSQEPEQDPHSYEELGQMAFGKVGKLVVMVSKFAYSVGSLIAYMVVIRDNLAPALQDLLYHHHQSDQYFSNHTASHHHHTYHLDFDDRFYWILSHNAWCTWMVSALVVLPLCLMRDMSAFAAVSVISILGKLAIVGIVSYFWWIGVHDDNTSNNDHPPNVTMPLYETSQVRFQDHESDHDMGLFHRHWFQIHWMGMAENLGTFVFCFVCQHTAHLTFLSLKPSIRNLSSWKTVSTASLTIACVVSLAVGLFVYMTFWERSQSDIFELYPPSPTLNVAKLLLCGTMLLTFPLPFLTCRELIIVFFWPFADQRQHGESNGTTDNDVMGSLQEPLLAAVEDQSQVENDVSLMDSCEVEENDDEENHRSMEIHPSPELNRAESVITNTSLADLSGVLSSRAIELMNSVLLPGEERQLKHIYHVALTCKLWFVVTGLAIASPNLGDVLALVGCVSGTLIAFILPACFAWKLQGCSHTATILLVAGGFVGIVGTIVSAKKFVQDSASQFGKI